ncbi:DUF2927 domain-containing protein [Aureimonas jatrophae]|jgi:hypothetical protein|uniref:DUF2927 domain-containing protein n=1 Tax=Aureimonas jatrophae TaxID=1166073 RepID=A0A1H0DKW4_9HYPH|nr:DUF2927 domain-containing protein [Aureimonas jatrophae]MBB3951955.1 hypothetical protein [Aureimonas jatrophae]SDN70897.1 Protein of unknown function [Aureimonas jatrophae]
MGRVVRALATLALLLVAPAGQAAPLPAPAEVIRGFETVVFGAEYTGAFSDSSYVKKFVRPVRVAIEARASSDRSAAVRAFVRQMGRSIRGLDIAMAARGEPGNFTVHVVDRAAYGETVRRIYGNPLMETPGNCIVRTLYGRDGITRSDAVLVSDEGDALFRRCLVEELLQGLGPLNDNSDAADSVFNDTSRLTSFTPYDRLILNMLYDPRLRPGLSQTEAAPLLPAIQRDARRRLSR